MASKGNRSESNRFKKGQSGNPNGRPRKKPETLPSAFDIVIDKRLTVTQQGVARELTVEEALQHKTYQEAITGSRSAQRQVLKMIAKREKAIAAQAPPAPPTKVLYQWTDPRNADEAMLILGIVSHDDRWKGYTLSEDVVRLLLEPWAVKAALSRGGAKNLTKYEIDLKKAFIRDDGTIRWPEADE